MIEFNRVFLDTSIFIYFFEDNEKFGDKVDNFFAYCLQSNVEFVSSIITHMEFCVRPYELKKYKLIDKFQQFLKDLNIHLFDVDFRIADLASRLRGKHKALKGMDAIQIATAIYSNCDTFVTNDKKLKDINEIKINLISDWEMV